MEFVIIAFFLAILVKLQISALLVLKITTSTIKQVHALRYVHQGSHNILINAFHALLNVHYAKILQIIAYRALKDTINIRMEAVCKIAITINTLTLLKKPVRNVFLHVFPVSLAHYA